MSTIYIDQFNPCIDVNLWHLLQVPVVTSLRARIPFLSIPNRMCNVLSMVLRHFDELESGVMSV